MKDKTTETNRKKTDTNIDEFEALLFGAALKTRCGYRLVKMLREENRNNLKNKKA